MINGTVLTLSQWQSQVSITQWYCNCELRHGKCSSLSCMRDSILKYRCFEWSLRPNYWPAKIYHWLRGWQEHIAGHHSQSSSSALLSLKISRPKLLSRRLLSIRLQLFSLNPPLNPNFWKMSFEKSSTYSCNSNAATRPLQVSRLPYTFPFIFHICDLPRQRIMQ